MAGFTSSSLLQFNSAYFLVKGKQNTFRSAFKNTPKLSYLLLIKQLLCGCQHFSGIISLICRSVLEQRSHPIQSYSILNFITRSHLLYVWMCQYHERMLVTLDGVFAFKLIYKPILVCSQPELSEIIAFLWAWTPKVTPKPPDLVLVIWDVPIVSIYTINHSSVCRAFVLYHCISCQTQVPCVCWMRREEANSLAVLLLNYIYWARQGDGFWGLRIRTPLDTGDLIQVSCLNKAEKV